MRNSTILALLVAACISFYIVANFDEDQIKKAIEESGLTGVYISEQEYAENFDYFIAKYRRNYPENAEYNLRFEIFKENYKFIQNHNSKAEVNGFLLGINKFGDITNQEYRDIYLKLKTNVTPLEHELEKDEFQNPFEISKTEQAIRDLKIPVSVDWITHGAVSAVKDQGECGSCYAFSAIAAIEGIYRISGKTSSNLSEQQMVDCSDNHYGNKGCDGGLMTNCFNYAHENDLCVSDKYPYVAAHNTCLAWLRCRTDNYIAGYKNVAAGSRFELYTAIAQQPVSVAIDAASDQFRFYKSGVMSSGCDSNLNHGVTAVGYGLRPYWYFWTVNFIYIKNSWGSDWGENGFVALGSNNETGNGTCGVYMDASYPVL